MDTGSFPGTFKRQSQRLRRTSHPHLRLQECMVHVPALQSGDTFWWHADVSCPNPGPLLPRPGAFG